MTGAEARYFDGLRPVPQPALAHLEGRTLTLRLVETGMWLRWSLAETRIVSEDHGLTLGRMRHGADTGERLTITDRSLVEALKVRAPGMTGGRAHARRADRRIALWAVAAVISLGLLVRYGLPVFADVVAPFVPWRAEAALGRAVEPQVLELLGKGKPARLCQSEGGAGRRALDLMVTRLTAGASLPGPLRVDVVDVGELNAFALPGGRIVLFRSLVEGASGPDEVAGVLGHEIGHVINRDTMRALVHDGALGVVLGIILGDVTGGSTAYLVSKFLLGNRFSREAERAADRIGIELVTQAGGDPTAMANFFRRMMAGSGGLALPDLLSTHPVNEERISTIEAARGEGRATALLGDAEWRALKTICGEG